MATEKETRKTTEAIGETDIGDEGFRDPDIKAWGFQVVGDALTGYFVGSRVSQSKFGTLLHRFLAKGEPIDVWGNGYLDNFLKRTTPGVLVRAVFTHLDTESEGNPAKVVKCKIDPTKRLDPNVLIAERAAMGRSAQSAPKANGKTSDIAEDEIPF